MANFPSIFNDVIGPVMRGPSSSHCAASLRIARIGRDLMDEDITDILIEFDPEGSLATTHKSQGSDMGLFGGFLGWEAHDERLPESDKYLYDAGIDVKINIIDIGNLHPNLYKITLSNHKESKVLQAISTGGGMIEVISIDGVNLSMHGDFYETLIYCKNPGQVKNFIEITADYDEIITHDGDIPMLQIKAQSFFEPDIIIDLWKIDGIMAVKQINPVLPVLSRKDMSVPFQSCEEMMEYNKSKNLTLWQLAVEYEKMRGNLSEKEVFQKMKAIVDIMKDAVRIGLNGTSYEDRILGSQSPGYEQKYKSGQLAGGDVINRIVMYVTAVMEVKSSMGVIVAAPTAGSCGALPGALIAMADSLNLSDEELVKAMLSAGLIGVFIAHRATFAAEVGGCMAETGSGGGMAAAALVQMQGGNLDQSIAAASLALQNSLGIICDPIGNRVEAPCLGRNVMAASNALTCANMALANYQHLIPLDQVIDTMKAVGDQIHHTLRCTNLGGLSVTPAAKVIESKLTEAERVVYKSC